MFSIRGPRAIALRVSLFLTSTYLSAGGSPPLGILTRAYEAHLNTAEAHAGLSVFAGETLATSADGKLGVRVGAATLTYSQGALATLQRIRRGTHVDMAAGDLFDTTPETAFVEVHIAGAVLRPEGNQAKPAEIQRLGPKVIQVSARHGNLELYYGEEFRLIPE